jgi:phage host-nuclease inhibitor protein Gam
MEVIIYSPQPGQALAPVDFNYEELRQELAARLEKYKGLVYTDETISEAKTDRATLNRVEKALNDKKIEIKKQYLEPYEEFEKKIKALMGMVSEQSTEIDRQVKSYEQKKKDEKKASIEAYYAEHIGDLAELLPLERIFSDKWLNATCRDKEWQTAIDEAVRRTSSDLQTIADLKSEFELQIKDTYLRTLDLSAALNEKTRLEQQKAMLAEYEAKKAKEAKEAEPPEVIEPEIEAVPVYDPVYVAERTKTIKVIFYDTTSVFRQEMKELTEKHNIRYGGIK